MEPVRLFTIKPTGDPFNRHGWDVTEYEKSYKDNTCIFRGDISPIQGKENAILYLERFYPGCKVKTE